MSNQKLPRKVWIHGPIWDSIFIFCGIGLLLAVSITHLVARGDIIKLGIITAVIRLALSPSHLLAPILLVIFNINERKKVLLQNPNYYKICASIIFLNLLVFGLSAILYNSQYKFEYVYILFSLIGGIFYGWNAWHFATQQYGIIQIYRNLAGLKLPERKYEFLFCIFILMLLPAPFIFTANLRDSFFSFHFGKLYWTTVTQTYVYFALVGSLYFAFKLFKNRNLMNLQVALSYLQILGMAAFLCILPGVISLLMFGISHWLQELFLISKIHSKTGTEGYPQRTLQILTNLGAIIIWGGG